MPHKKLGHDQEEQFDEDAYQREDDDVEEFDSKRTRKDSGVSRHRARGRDKQPNDDD